MHLRVFLICLLISPIAIEVSHAKDVDDIIREQKALLILDDFQQALELQYQYQESATDSGSGSAHGFREKYHANLEGDLIDPHLLKAKLDASIGLDQSFVQRDGGGSASGQNYRYNYQFNASGLDRSVTPFSINSYKTSTTVISPFSPTFTSDTSGEEFRIQLRNTLLPSSFSFSRVTVDNSGGGNDSSSVSNSFNYSATHAYQDFSFTSLSFSANSATGGFNGAEGLTTRSYSANLNNKLRWANGKYTLSSIGQIYDQMSQNVPQRTITLSEGFDDRLGKALDLHLGYAYSKSSTTVFDGQDTELVLQLAEASLKHRLFQSVVTSLGAKVSKADNPGGTEYMYLGIGSLGYTKRLPDHNILTLSAVGSHLINDNQSITSQVTTTNQAHPGVHQGDTIELPLTGILKRVDTVKSGVLIYTELSDYTVDLGRGTITIVRGGRIDDNGAGTDLLITYTETVTPRTKFVSDTYGLSGAISFDAGKYQLGASYQNQTMSSDQGSASQLALRESSTKRIYFGATLDKLSYRASYNDSNVGDLEMQSLEGSANYTLDLKLSTLSLAGSERYSWYSATSAVPAYVENTMTCSAMLVRSLGPYGRLNLSANAFDERNDLRGSRDIFTLRGNWSFAKGVFSALVDGQTSWTIAQGQTTRNSILSVSVRRSF
jgi:hypothetical protein